MNLSASLCDFTAQGLFPHLYMAISKTRSQDEIHNTINCSEPGCLRMCSLEAESEVEILVKVIFSESEKEQGKKAEQGCGLSRRLVST